MDFVIKGNIVYSKDKDHLELKENGYLVVESGKVLGVFDSFEYKNSAYQFYDFTNKLVMPGMVDLHIHAPQYRICAIGMDLELIDWLNTYTFNEEAKYGDEELADINYKHFTNKMVHSATTSAVVFATIHKDSTLKLMKNLDESGLKAYVGKVNMDRNSIPELQETCCQSVENTIKFIEEAKFNNVKPIITPRFLPSCSDNLLDCLGKIAKKYDLPIQSHLSENPTEVKWVKELFPDVKSYAFGYDKYNLLTNKTIMAHCIYLEPDEEKLLKERGVFIAHCPSSNMNVSSGIAPIRRYIDEGINVGLATDVAGGESESMFRAIRTAIQVSKMYFRLVDNNSKALSFPEAFYLATLGGGKFFGNTGTFDKGFDADIIVIDDAKILNRYTTLTERIERAIYLELDRDSIIGKFVKGKRLI